MPHPPAKRVGGPSAVFDVKWLMDRGLAHAIFEFWCRNEAGMVKKIFPGAQGPWGANEKAENEVFSGSPPGW